MMQQATEDTGPQKNEFERNGGGKVSPASTTGKYDPETLEIDHVAEKKLVRKLDRYIVPMVMLLYLLVSLMLSLFSFACLTPPPSLPTRPLKSSCSFEPFSPSSTAST